MPGVARLNDTISHGGNITSASTNTITNGRGTARKGDSVVCNIHGAQTITGGSTTVFVNGRSVARLGDSISCGATISSASTDTIAG